MRLPCSRSHEPHEEGRGDRAQREGGNGRDGRDGRGREGLLRFPSAKRVEFPGANLVGTDLTEADVKKADFTDVDLTAVTGLCETDNLDTAHGVDLDELCGVYWY